MDPKYKSEVLLQRGAEALAKEKVPLRLVAGRSEKIVQPTFFSFSACHRSYSIHLGKTCYVLLPGHPALRGGF